MRFLTRRLRCRASFDQRDGKKGRPEGIPGGYFILGFLGVTGVSVYFAIIQPMINPSKWQKIQEETRKGIDQSKIQPGDMDVWRDPYDRKKPKSS